MYAMMIFNVFIFVKEITDLCVHILEDLSKRLGELAPKLEQVKVVPYYSQYIVSLFIIGHLINHDHV